MTEPIQEIKLNRGTIHFPAFLPDGTVGVVRSLDATDLASCQVQAAVMNTFHLMQKPGSSTIQSLGGLHRMTGWEGPILTDSGGFQAYSMIRQNSKFGRLTDHGISFQPEGSTRKYQLSPEKCVQLQLGYDADIVVCLDDCTHVDASYAEQRQAVERTIAWAKRCKREFYRILDQKRIPETERPLLFGVIQGGGEKDLRRACAEALLEEGGFGGFGYGGWPLDAQNHLLTDMIGLVRELVPPHLPVHALGVGHPENVQACYELGYQMFDSAMPTRDARHARLYTFRNPADGEDQGLSGSWLDYLYVGDQKHIKASRPVSPFCDGLCCQRYSLGYLHHLFKLDDTLYYRLATLHNLRFMTQLTERLRRRTHV
jgi:queuine tRNA-ribosyltransferase